MKVTKENLNEVIAQLRKCAVENAGRCTNTGEVCITIMCDDVADFLQDLNDAPNQPLYPKLTSDDVRDIVNLADQELKYHTKQELREMGEVGYYELVLKAFVAKREAGQQIGDC